MAPLYERMRPQNLDEIFGQQHLVGKEGVIRRMVENKRLSSMIFWGPPGVGKTTLARILAKECNTPLMELTAIQSGVKEVRDCIEKARNSRFFDSNAPILFIDEIHRFSKSQQDSLLGAVEKGIITLIGATTENPSFEVIPALLSRCHVFVLNHLDENDLDQLLSKCIGRDELLKNWKVSFREKEELFRFAAGDARKLMNILEILFNQSDPSITIAIDNALVAQCLQKNMMFYDKGGEQHYDIISAFIKSLRGSDPHAALYWMSRMLLGGEPPEFIARRMLILAAEDIGLANPNALLLANACFEAVLKIGMPESRISLSEAVIYLATSPKSNSAYMAVERAYGLARDHSSAPVPLHLRNAVTGLMKDLSYGKDYRYSHDYSENFSPQEYFPEELSGTKLYLAGKNPPEEKIQERLSHLWQTKYKD